MPRRRNPSPNDLFDFARLGFDAWMVMSLRAARFALGGPAATKEMQRMFAEKAAAALEAQAAAGFALAIGKSSRTAGRSALARYRRRVKANRKRLTGKR